jgi:hypothetical protein
VNLEDATVIEKDLQGSGDVETFFDKGIRVLRKAGETSIRVELKAADLSCGGVAGHEVF